MQVSPHANARPLAADYALVATFPDMSYASRAIEALQNAGVEASRIDLVGPSADAARRPDRSSANASDLRILWRALWKGFWWSVWGGMAGALAGVFVWWADLPLPGFGESLALQVASWAMFGHVAAAICGMYAGIGGMGAAWELSNQGWSGPVQLGVRARGKRDTARLSRIMRERGAAEVTEADRPG